MKYVGRGAVRVPSMYGLTPACVASSPAPVPSPSAAAGDSPKKFPTQKSAVNGPAGDALTASTRLYSAGRLPRTSPAIRILTVFGSDISPVSLRWPGARELW